MLNSLKQRVGSFSAVGWEGEHWPLSLLIGFTQRKSKLSLIFMTEDSFTTWNQVPTENRLLPYHRGREIGALFFVMIIFTEMASKSLKKIVLEIVKTGQRHLKIYTSQKSRERICNYKCSKFYALRKGKGRISWVRPRGFCKGQGWEGGNKDKKKPV